MNIEEKQLLLKDLCARLLYGVKAKYYNADEKDYMVGEIEVIDLSENEPYVYIKDCGHCCYLDEMKIYLRPMYTISSIEEQELEYRTDGDYVDYCCKHHLDYRGLIEKGFAIEAPKDMYKTEKR